jgi:hypothetical protein
MEWPKTFATLVVGGKLLGPILDSIVWFKNGIALAKGFSAGSGGFLKTLTGNLANSATALGVKGGKLGLKGAGMAAGAGIVGYAINNSTSDSDNDIVRRGGGIIGGALQGAALGSIGGPWGIGIGALGGAAWGAYNSWNKGEEDSNKNVITANDSVIKFNPNDKFTKVDDGTMIAGTNANGNASLARSISNMMAPGNNSNTGAITSATNNIKLSDLNITGSIELKLGANISREIGENLIKDSNFVRNLSNLINVEVAKAKNLKIS